MVIWLPRAGRGCVLECATKDFPFVGTVAKQGQACHNVHRYVILQLTQAGWVLQNGMNNFMAVN